MKWILDAFFSAIPPFLGGNRARVGRWWGQAEYSTYVPYSYYRAERGKNQAPSVGVFGWVRREQVVHIASVRVGPDIAIQGVEHKTLILSSIHLFKNRGFPQEKVDGLALTIR